MSVLSFVFIVAGIVCLWIGGEALVRGAVDLSRLMGLSPLVIGLTVVAFATSAPELAATLTASFQDAPDVAVGNVLGSNVANIGLILGISALIQPLASRMLFIQRELPFMVVVSVGLLVVLDDLVVSRGEGTFLFAVLLLYLWFCLAKGEGPVPADELEEIVERELLPTWQAVLFVSVGIAFLVLGAYLLVEGAVTVARALGVPDRVIGLTMVAFGTSLPELASSVVAARHRHGDLVLGNIVGSNIFNILCILGLTSMIRPLPVSPEILGLDVWLVIAFSVLVLPLHWPNLRLGRTEGAALLVLYLGYVWYLFAG